ncbi:MAG TPA: sigma-70 family RNA polymerase sigma factor [Polyangiaceae bacterium]|jgi:RNA polymerase sigma factor (sigma-70 family)|nr:sigma-70 family RNA polymerase sigma factor [Polyangiaceae bacterium]
MSIVAPFSGVAPGAGPGPTSARASRASRLADPALAAALGQFVSRSRVAPADVDDVVQSALTEALAAPSGPEDAAEIRRWVFGIARHKVADWFRARRREVPLEDDAPQGDAVAVPGAGVQAAPEVTAEANKLLSWAERELPAGPENARTLQWLLREGQGETLESIAAEESVEAPRVRQRVSRLRKHYRARWAIRLAALATVVVAAIVLAMTLRKKRDEVAPRIHPTLGPSTAPSIQPLRPFELLPMPLPPSRPATAAPRSSAPVTVESSEPPVETATPPEPSAPEPSAAPEASAAAPVASAPDPAEAKAPPAAKPAATGPTKRVPRVTRPAGTSDSIGSWGASHSTTK